MESPPTITPSGVDHHQAGLWFFYTLMPLLTSKTPWPQLASPSTFMPASSGLSLCLLAGFLIFFLLAAALVRWAAPGGPAWPACNTIPGPRGLPVVGSLLDMGHVAHRRLAQLAGDHNAGALMALSLGGTRVVVASEPGTARDILAGGAFSDRPLKDSVRGLRFHRAIGFAPHGDYWRQLRRIAASFLFSPRRIAAHARHRQAHVDAMLEAISRHVDASVSVGRPPSVTVRPFLEQAALNNVMSTVFGRTYQMHVNVSKSQTDQERSEEEARELRAMVREGFDLLGAFNVADHFPQLLQALDPLRVRQRCAALLPRVHAFVSKILRERRQSSPSAATSTVAPGDDADFVDVLLSMQVDEKLDDEDIIAILWEMIFRGTDSVAILLEWALAELIINPPMQAKLAAELDFVVGPRHVVDTDIPNLPYLQAVVHETLRAHPPGPLLSWARLATHDVEVAGHHVPAGTTAMVNMWAITHNPTIWVNPNTFEPAHFMGHEAVDIRGNDLRLAPFGAGRRVCPGRAMGLATVYLWLARCIQCFEWTYDTNHPIDLTEHLKLSCEMKSPLVACPTQRALP